MWDWNARILIKVTKCFDSLSKWNNSASKVNTKFSMSTRRHSLTWYIGLTTKLASLFTFSCIICLNTSLLDRCYFHFPGSNLSFFPVACLDEPFQFRMNFRQAENYPVDIYFLMDVSNTMKQYKDTLAELSDQLGRPTLMPSTWSSFAQLHCLIIIIIITEFFKPQRK